MTCGRGESTRGTPHTERRMGLRCRLRLRAPRARPLTWALLGNACLWAASAGQRRRRRGWRKQPAPRALPPPPAAEHQPPGTRTRPWRAWPVACTATASSRPVASSQTWRSSTCTGGSGRRVTRHPFRSGQLLDASHSLHRPHCCPPPPPPPPPPPLPPPPPPPPRIGATNADFDSTVPLFRNSAALAGKSVVWVFPQVGGT